MVPKTLAEEKLLITAETRKLGELQASEKNARVMPGVQLKRLARNIARDGMLSSAPLVYGKRIISGHHRVKAALEAGIEEATCLCIQGKISEDRLTAIQLSHNALVGEDDPVILAEMLSNLPPIEQNYAAVPPIEQPALPSLGPALGIDGGVKIEIEFPPHELEDVKNCLERAGKHPEKIRMEAASALHDFLDTLFAVKAFETDTGLLSPPVTLHRMAVLAQERLDQLEATSEVE